MHPKTHRQKEVQNLRVSLRSHSAPLLLPLASPEKVTEPAQGRATTQGCEYRKVWFTGGGITSPKTNVSHALKYLSLSLLLTEISCPCFLPCFAFIVFSVVYINDWKTSWRNSDIFSQKNLKNMLSFLDTKI